MLLSEALTPIRHTGFAAGDRLDPFYDGLWSAGSRGVWASAPETRRQMEAGLGDLDGMSVIDSDEALKVVTDPANFERLLPALGVIENMRTTTIEQLSALTAHNYTTARMRTLLSAAFAAGLIDIGRVSDLLGNGISSVPGYLLRPAKGRQRIFDKKIRRHLTLPEQISVTGGYPYSTGGQYDRHNIISVEMLLRAAELLDIGTIVGEKHCTADMLFGSGLGRRELVGGIRGDGMIVRDDGMRIAIEMTSSANAADMWRKVRGWAEHMDSSSFARNGVIVLFVIAPSFESNHTESALVSNVKRSVKRAMSMFPGSGKVRMRDRFAIAHWTDWFPTRDTVDPSFLSLRSRTRTGTGEDMWLDVDLLDDERYDADFSFDAEAVIGNLAACHQTPPWIRQQHAPPDLTQTILSGVCDRVPILPPVKKEFGDTGEWITADQARSVAGGAVDSITAPPRMRTLGA